MVCTLLKQDVTIEIFIRYVERQKELAPMPGSTTPVPPRIGNTDYDYLILRHTHLKAHIAMPYIDSLSAK